MRAASHKQAPIRLRGEPRGSVFVGRAGKVLVMALALVLLAAACLVRANDAIDADDAKRQAVTAEFFRLYRAGRLPASWKDQSEGGDFVVYLDNATSFKGADFDSLQPPAKGDGYYIASVCAHGDPRQPTYLYLISWKHRKFRLIRAVHLEGGKAQKIDI